MPYKVLTLNDRVYWNEVLNRLPVEQQDIYFTPEYYELYEQNGDGKAHCFVFENNGNVAVYPFLMNSINKLGLLDLEEEFYDIQGAYGYNGVVSYAHDQEFAGKFYGAFFEFCHAQNIVAEFSRFHPLLENFKFSEKFMDVTFDRKTVYLNLEKGYEYVWEKEYHPKNRNTIRKAQKHNLSAEIYANNGYDDFCRLYNETMTNLNAEDNYFYNQLYFENFKNLLGNKQRLITVQRENEIACSLLLMLDGDYAHYHLSGRRHGNFGANNLALDVAVRLSIDLGCKRFHLGGGTSNGEDDPLFKFKAAFSKAISDFYVGKKVHNKETYDNLVQVWEEQFPQKKQIHENVLLRYRI